MDFQLSVNAFEKIVSWGRTDISQPQVISMCPAKTNANYLARLSQTVTQRAAKGERASGFLNLSLWIDRQLEQADSARWVQVFGTDIDAPGPLAAPFSGSFDRVHFVLPWGHRNEPFSYLHSTVLSVGVAF